ncbi:hypothetical protein [Comamonas sp. JC664]|uniref:hypothetical protein n=1 Tax=Comamonas sp. JC664 TaxID=2801917 RepID=UPI00174D8F76|nr:hypothetical protein [Comamonas sp. JC664]
MIKSLDSLAGMLQALPRVGTWFQEGDIQPEEVRAFWRHMQRCFQTDAAQLAGSLGGGPCRASPCLQLPFEVGVPRAGWDLWRQVVACVHAHQHVLLDAADGPSAARTRHEVEALRSDLELHFWRRGTTPSPWRLASHLRAPGCRSEDITWAAHTLALASASIRQGAVENEASHVALQWLEAHVPRLRWDKAYHPSAR